jgi:lysophospholipase L1-like esterase
MFGLFRDKGLFDSATLSATTTVAKVFPYGDAATSGTANGGVGTNSNIEYLFSGNRLRIAQTGTVKSLKAYLGTTANLSSVVIRAWRKNGATYDLVGSTENILSKITPNSINTIVFSQPIYGVTYGDYVSIRIIGTGSAGYLLYFYSATGSSGYYATNQTPSESGYDWESKTSYSDQSCGLELYMNSPRIIGIGDSIMSGALINRAFTVNSPVAFSPAQALLGHLTSSSGYSYQNMGVGSNTTTQMLARFQSDVVVKNPRTIIIQGGGNDIGVGATQATFISNYTAMLDACLFAKVIVVLITPWTTGTNGQLQTADAWNSALISLVDGYNNAVVFDPRPIVGQFRTGGDAGNMWDIIPAYTTDGVHFTSEAYALMAAAIRQIGV